MVEDNYQGMAMFREGGLKINEIAQRVQEHKDENPDAVDDCFACLYESPLYTTDQCDYCGVLWMPKNFKEEHGVRFEDINDLLT